MVGGDCLRVIKKDCLQEKRCTTCSRIVKRACAIGSMDLLVWQAKLESWLERDEQLLRATVNSRNG